MRSGAKTNEINKFLRKSLTNLVWFHRPLIYNPNYLETEAGKSKVQKICGPQSKLKASLDNL